MNAITMGKKSFLSLLLISFLVDFISSSSIQSFRPVSEWNKKTRNTNDVGNKKRVERGNTRSLSGRDELLSGRPDLGMMTTEEIIMNIEKGVADMEANAVETKCMFPAIQAKTGNAFPSLCREENLQAVFINESGFPVAAMFGIDHCKPATAIFPGTQNGKPGAMILLNENINCELYYKLKQTGEPQTGEPQTEDIFVAPIEFAMDEFGIERQPEQQGIFVEGGMNNQDGISEEEEGGILDFILSLFGGGDDDGGEGGLLDIIFAIINIFTGGDDGGDDDGGFAGGYDDDGGEGGFGILDLILSLIGGGEDDGGDDGGGFLDIFLSLFGLGGDGGDDGGGFLDIFLSLFGLGGDGGDGGGFLDIFLSLAGLGGDGGDGGGFLDIFLSLAGLGG